MKKSISGWLGLAVLAGWSLMGCASGGGADQSEETSEVGKLALPLVTNGPSGTQYQLRNATFQIQSTRYYYGVGGSTGKGGAVAMGGAMPVTGGATSVSVPAPIIVSSETNPTEPTIEVDLEQGDYRVVLLPGWSLESVVDGVSTPVPEVQLLSGESQWVWVSPRSTSWVSYQFGIGGRNVWFNGKLNIEMQVYETPDDYYGPGYGGSAGATWVPAGGVATTIPAAGGAYGRCATDGSPEVD
ncbi:MAG: hypothetical protein ACM3ZE_20620 [Myxococcales bacterium]